MAEGTKNQETKSYLGQRIRSNTYENETFLAKLMQTNVRLSYGSFDIENNRNIKV